MKHDYKNVEYFYKCIFVKNHGYFTECKILSSFTVYNPTQKTA